MKKALAILVSVMLMATICMTASASVCTLKLADVEVEEGTATVEVPMTITANDGIFGFLAEVTYDSSVVEFASVAAGDLFTVTPNPQDGSVKLVVEGKDVAASVTETGIDAVVLTFNVVGAAGDTAAIEATLPDPENNINADGDNVDTTIAAGSVSIVAAAEPSEEPTQPTQPSEEPTEPSEEPTQPTQAPTQAPTTAPTQAPTQAPANNNGVPSTGSVIPAAAVVLASASAAVLCFARKK